MEYLKVKLWGKEIGRLAWDNTTRRTYFMYNPSPEEDIPDIAPLLSPARSRNTHVPVYGDDRPLYQDLPPFIADSLPDSWGNRLFDEWVRNNRISRNLITPLYKLMFIGSRGMGALEYEPSASDMTHHYKIDIKSLYDMSLRILEDRERIVLSTKEKLTMQALLAVGTSAGGRQMKALIAINEQTGEIRSGQTDGLDGFDYYILKFGDRMMPVAEIETAYYYMAVAAGIDMEECRLMPVEGVNHFLTRRFDRVNGRKLHTQTLAAINPEARSYEDLVATCRDMGLSETQVEQVFTRMAFNVMTNNTDDHNKNFSFLLEEGGLWRLAPAYDVTYIFNTYATGPNHIRRMAVGGKVCDITLEDLYDFAKQNGISNASSIINRIAASVVRFDEFADRSHVPHPWRGIIRKTLNENLAAFGLVRTENTETEFIDKNGRKIADLQISVNSKGHFDVAAVIDGKRYRRFIRPNMDLHSGIRQFDIDNLPIEMKLQLISELFPTV
ncbi:MAG: type II toxin-antitoxin system HipA family toxin [Clostridium sp.]|nr:type II toxin-antitoxin system HipA family toxin [Clostridium sp.]